MVHAVPTKRNEAATEGEEGGEGGDVEDTDAGEPLLSQVRVHFALSFPESEHVPLPSADGDIRHGLL